MARRRNSRKKKHSSGGTIAVTRKPRVSAKRKLWSDESIIAAMEAVRKGIISINKAAVLHGVPCTTLKDRLSGRVKHGTKPGPSRYLSTEEEKELADHLVEVAKVGYGKTRKQVMTIAENVAKEKSMLRKKRISNGWWRRFRERQPQLSLRRGDPTAHVRMDATSKQIIKEYYDLLGLKMNWLILQPKFTTWTRVACRWTLVRLILLSSAGRKRCVIVSVEKRSRLRYVDVPMP